MRSIEVAHPTASLRSMMISQSKVQVPIAIFTNLEPISMNSIGHEEMRNLVERRDHLVQLHRAGFDIMFKGFNIFNRISVCAQFIQSNQTTSLTRRGQQYPFVRQVPSHPKRV
jgi:hypothetical protein